MRTRPFPCPFLSPLGLLALLGFLALLGPMTGPAAAERIRDEGVIAVEPASAYAGSARCADCHREHFDRWSRTLKSRFVRYRRDVAALPGQWRKSPLRGDRDRVFVVVGLQRKAAFVDADWRVMDAEYLLDKGRWKVRPEWRGADYRSRCGACHLTGCNPLERRFTELGVGCEACHGPGGRHAAGEDPADILLPGRDGGDALSTCRRCHNGRNNHARALAGFNGTYHTR